MKVELCLGSFTSLASSLSLSNHDRILLQPRYGSQISKGSSYLEQVEIGFHI